MTAQPFFLVFWEGGFAVPLECDLNPVIFCLEPGELGITTMRGNEALQMSRVDPSGESEMSKQGKWVVTATFEMEALTPLRTLLSLTPYP